MPLTSNGARKLAVAGFAALATLAVASPAQAVQSATLTYRCKYPLIGTNPLSIKIDLDIPNTWPAGKTTDPFGITATASAGGNTVPGLSLVEGLAAIEGVSSARSIVQVPGGGPPVVVNVPITIPKYVLPTPVPDPLVLIAKGSTPPLTIDEPGEATIVLDKLALNLKATDAAGDPIILPPVTKDIDLQPVKDSDGDPNTFDVYCKVDAGQNMTLGKFTLVPDNAPPSKPGTPALDAATTTETTLGFSWAASTDDNAVTGYDIYNGATKVKTVTGTSTTLTGLTANTAYSIKVVANDNGTPVLSTSSDVASLKTKAAVDTPPSKPGTLTGTPSETSVALSWGASTDDKGVTGYNVYKGAVKVDTVTGTSYNATGLTAGTAYNFKVEAVDTAGQKTAGDEITVTTTTKPVDNPPSKPVVTGTPSETSVALSWGASTDDKGVTGYNVYKGAVKVDTVTGTSYSAAGLTAGTAYKFKVEAIDTAGQTTSSDEITVTTTTKPIDNPPTKPGTPTGTSITKDSAAITWTASSDDQGVTGYNVYKDGAKVDTVTGTSYSATGLTADTTYKFKVEAVDTIGQKTLSDELTLKTAKGPVVDVDPPSTPTNFKATPAKTSVALSWTASTDDVGPITYSIFGAVGGPKLGEVSGTTFTVPNLTADTAYTFTVVANDAANHSSGAATVSTKTLPATGGTVDYSYSLAGSTTLKTLTKGTLPLKGGIDATLTLATGEYTADLTLADTQGRLTALGFLPLTAKVGFVPSGKTTGKLADGVLTSSSKVRIKVKEVKLFGAIPLAGGNNCQTKSLSDINLKSTGAEFVPTVGGTLAGTYDISDLNGCGSLNGLVSPLTAGKGNTISLKLTPKANVPN